MLEEMNIAAAATLVTVKTDLAEHCAQEGVTEDSDQASIFIKRHAKRKKLIMVRIEHNAALKRQYEELLIEWKASVRATFPLIHLWYCIFLFVMYFRSLFLFQEVR